MSKESFGMSVRCVAWANEDGVLVGCMDGTLTLWNITQNTVWEIKYIRGYLTKYL